MDSVEWLDDVLVRSCGRPQENWGIQQQWEQPREGAHASHAIEQSLNVRSGGCVAVSFVRLRNCLSFCFVALDSLDECHDDLHGHLHGHVPTLVLSA